MNNSSVYRQGKVFINSGPHNIIFSISPNIANTSVFIAFSVNPGLHQHHTSRHMEKVLRICVSVCKSCRKVRFVNLLLGVTGARCAGAGGGEEVYKTTEHSGVQKRRHNLLFCIII